MATALVTLAFGTGTTLYDALRCDRTVDATGLRKAYHRAALSYHPDQAAQRGHLHASDVRASTLKFQAVSSAYEVLRDPVRRARYDADRRDDGPAPDSKNSSNDDDDDGDRQQRWQEFFCSVLREVVRPADDDDDETYRGSERERTDVLRYYVTCKGDWDKVADCVMLRAEQGDRERWRRDVVRPAVRRGEVPAYNRADGAPGEDENDNDVIRKKCRGHKRLRKTHRPHKPSSKAGTPTTNADTPSSCNLIDTDEEEEEASSPTLAVEMSTREKMEYRVAKKRKHKAEREREVADLFRAKDWTGSDLDQELASAARRQRSGTFSDKLLSAMEQKYKTRGGQQDDRRGTRKKSKKNNS